MNEPWSFGLVALRTAQGALGAVVLGPLGAYLGVLPPVWGFAVFVVGGALGFLNAIAGLVVFSRGERWRGTAAMLLGGAAGVTLAYSSIAGIGKPPINDISTDLVEPPILVGAQTQPGNVGRDLVYPESFKEVVRTSYADLKPLRLEDPPDAVFSRAIALAQARPDWQVIYVNGSSRFFEGVATSRLFRFQDDFVVRVRPDGAGSTVDMRSKSRDGKGDLGVNAERIRGFLAALGAARPAVPPAAAR